MKDYEILITAYCMEDHDMKKTQQVDRKWIPEKWTGYNIHVLFHGLMEGS
jgi:hypothetical protein